MKIVRLTQSSKARLLGLIILALAVVGCGGNYHQGKRLDNGMDYMAYRLNFDDEQTALLAKLKHELQAMKIDTEQDRPIRKEKIVSLINAPNFDAIIVEQLMAQGYKDMGLYVEQMLPLIQELHSTLTLEQKDKIEKSMRLWILKG